MAELSSIIKKVNKNTGPTKDWEKRIIFDEKGTLLEREPSFNLFKTSQYYLVSNSRRGLFADHTTSYFKIESFGENKSIDIKILSRVGCLPDEEARFAWHFGYKSDHSPENTLNDHIKDWINEFVGPNHNDFIDNFYQKEKGPQLLSHIEVKARDVGIVFQNIRFYLDGQEYLKKINLKNDKIETNFKDSTDIYAFSLEAALLVREDKKINVISTHKRPADLEKLIYDELREYFPKHVDFEAFSSDRSVIQNEITTYLNSVLERYGRKIGAFKLGFDMPDVPPTKEKDISFTIKTPNYPAGVNVQSKILIRRVDIAIYRNSGPENLDEWLENLVKTKIKTSFFNLRYSEIIERFESLKHEVKNDLNVLVNAIGYELEQIIVIPAFTELESLRKITFRIEGTFITEDQQEVKLKTEFQAAINDYSKISFYIDRNNTSQIGVDLKEVCLNEIKKYIHSVTVEDFHKYFEAEKDKFEIILKSVISENFGATITYFFFDRGEEEVVRKMASLKKEGWTDFSTVVATTSDYSKIAFSGQFRVESGKLELWQIFKNQDISVQDIRVAIETSLRSNLKTRQVNLVYRTDELRDKVHKEIERIAVETVESGFGLNIKIINIDRDMQDIEEKIIRQRKQLLERIETLDSDYIDSVAAGLYEVAEDILKRRTVLEERVQNMALTGAQLGGSTGRELTSGDSDPE